MNDKELYEYAKALAVPSTELPSCVEVLARALLQSLDECDALHEKIGHTSSDAKMADLMERATKLLEENVGDSALYKDAVADAFGRLRVLRQMWTINQIEDAISKSFTKLKETTQK